MGPCLCMGIVVNVDVMALYGSADVFSHVFLAVDEKAASDGNDPGIHSYCVTGSGKGPGAGAPSPALGADPAGAVGGELEISQRDQAPVGGSPRYSEARTDTAAATCPLCSSVTVTVTVWLSSGFPESQSQPDTAFLSTLSKCPFIFEVPARAMTQLTAVKSITSRRPAISLVFFMFTTSFLLCYIH